MHRRCRSLYLDITVTTGRLSPRRARDVRLARTLNIYDQLYLFPDSIDITLTAAENPAPFYRRSLLEPDHSERTNVGDEEEDARALCYVPLTSSCYPPHQSKDPQS